MHTEGVIILHHIKASFHLADDVTDPKIGGIRSGYAPHHKFKSIDFIVSGFHVYGDKDLHFPGEIIIVDITFPGWDFFKNRVNVGDVFEVFELDRLIGHGVVNEIYS